MGERHSSKSTVVQIQKTRFFPMLCSRPSIKSVSIPIIKSQDPTSSPSLRQHDDEPLSPKISCIGQVKRTNKIINLPCTTSIINTHHHNKLAITTANHHHYFKLKRIFSGKSLAFTAAVAKTTATTTTTTASSPRRKLQRRRRREESVKMNGSKIDENNGSVVNVVDLDPPLPVVKRKQDGGGSKTENLWKRRSGGLELRGLQIHHQQNRAHLIQLITVE